MHRNSGWAGHAYMIVAGALVGFALLLQFYLTANLVVAQGGHLVTARLVFLDFFTILTNILVLAALVAPWIAPESRLALFFRRPVCSPRSLATSPSWVSFTPRCCWIFGHQKGHRSGPTCYFTTSVPSCSESTGCSLSRGDGYTGATPFCG
jgi:hypothetical protein